MRKTIAVLGLLASIGTISCTSKNTTVEVESTSVKTSTANSSSAKETIVAKENEELKLVGTTAELYAASEEQMINMLNEPDQLRLQKAIQIVSNTVAETTDIYTEDDDIDHDKWHAAYCKKVDGLTFTGILQLAEQLLKTFKHKNITLLQEEITDLKNNPTENKEESMSFLQEELKNANQLPTTIDAYVYSEECFL